MLDLNGVFPLAEFQRDAKEHLERLSRTGRPQVLTVNGRPALVVQDAASYQRMLDEKERLEALASVRRGLDSMKRGETRPLEDVLGDIKREYE